MALHVVPHAEQVEEEHLEGVVGEHRAGGGVNPNPVEVLEVKQADFRCRSVPTEPVDGQLRSVQCRMRTAPCARCGAEAAVPSKARPSLRRVRPGSTVFKLALGKQKQEGRNGLEQLKTGHFVFLLLRSPPPPEAVCLEDGGRASSPIGLLSPSSGLQSGLGRLVFAPVRRVLQKGR